VRGIPIPLLVAVGLVAIILVASRYFIVEVQKATDPTGYAETENLLVETVADLDGMIALALTDPHHSYFKLDIENVISCYGSSNGSPSPSADGLLLKLMKSLHPEEYGDWTVDTVLLEMHLATVASGSAYAGPIELPTTLQLLKYSGTPCKEELAKRLREWFLMLALASAAVDGKVSDEGQAAILRFKSALEAGSG